MKPRPLPPLHHPVPPHELEKRQEKRHSDILKSVGIGFAITAVIAICMKTISMPLTVIFPTSAPIWMGFSTMLFMAVKD
jgi:hypothetical protein